MVFLFFVGMHAQMILRGFSPWQYISSKQFGNCLSGAPNENIVENHINIALLNVL